MQAGKIMLEHFQVGIESKSKHNDTPVTVANTKIKIALRRSYLSTGRGFSWKPCSDAYYR